MLVSILVPFFIYAVILFVVSYVVVEHGQHYFYDEVTSGPLYKAGAGALILAGLLTWTRTNFATMFTSEFATTVLLSIVWVGVFILIYRFNPWHGFGLAMATLLIFAGLSSLVVSSLTEPRPPGRIDVDQPVQKIRRSTGGAIVAPPAAEDPAKK